MNSIMANSVEVVAGVEPAPSHAEPNCIHTYIGVCHFSTFDCKDTHKN